MLNRKNLITLGVILAVLIVVAVWQQASHERATSRSSTEVLIAGELTPSDLSRITIDYGQQADVVVLENGPKHWLIPSAFGAEASQQRIDTLVRGLSNLRGEFRSDSREVLADYGFTDSTSITLHGFDPAGQELFALEIGGKPAGGMSNFVRRPGTSAVYLTSTSLLNNLGVWGEPEAPSSRHLLELQAYRAERQDVDRIALRGEETVTLVKDFAMIEPAEDDSLHTEPYPDRSQWEWRLMGKNARSLGMAVKTKADQVLNTAASLRGQDVVDPSAGLDAYGLGDNARALVVTFENGDEARFAFGDTREAEGKTPGGVYMVNLDDPATIWVVNEHTVKNIFKGSEELLPEKE
jgi:hypothetical protein